MTPIAIKSSGERATLRAELRGKFAGSPTTADFDFVLVNVASLLIRS